MQVEFWILQTDSRFLVMVLFAERLPVTLVPEQLLITPVRYDMIYDRCRDCFILLQALHTKSVAL